MRKFSKILALLLAVSLIGGVFALTASAAGETLVVSGTGAGGATPSMNRYYAFNESDADPTKAGTTYGSNNLITAQGWYTYSDSVIAEDSYGNSFIKSTYNSTKVVSGKNAILNISASASNTNAPVTTNSAANVRENVIVVDFDVCAFDITGPDGKPDGIADWSDFGIYNVYWGNNSTKGNREFGGFAFASYINDNTPGKWHHITLVAYVNDTASSKAEGSQHLEVSYFVDGVYKTYKQVHKDNAYVTADGIIEAQYFGIGNKLSGTTQPWSVGLDNVAVNSYNIADYGKENANPNTFAKVIYDLNNRKDLQNIGVGENAPLSAYSDSAYYTETYAPFNPNPAVATVDGVKYSTLNEALANLTDGKTLETKLNVENYTPGDVTSVNIKAPLVTLSDAAKAAGFVTATWNDVDGNAVMTTVCMSGAKATPPTIDFVPLADDDNPYRDWCTAAIGYSTEAVVITEDNTILTPDHIVPVEANVKGILYNVNLDTSFDIVVYAPVLYTKNADGGFELYEELPEGLEFDSISAQQYAQKFDSYQPVKRVGDVTYYSPAVYCQVSMRSIATQFVPEVNFTVNGVEMTYTMPAITIGSYADAVYAMEGKACGSDEFTLITAMLNYCMTYLYENTITSTSSGIVTPDGFRINKATFAIFKQVAAYDVNLDPNPGKHHACPCQDRLKTFANAPAEGEFGKLNSSVFDNDLVKGATMHVNYNEPSIGILVTPESIGHHEKTAGQGLINAYRYTYKNYRGETITKTVPITKDASNGGWDNYFAYGDQVLLKCSNIDVLDVLGQVEIELLTAKKVEATDGEGNLRYDEEGNQIYELEYSTIGASVKYSVAEYYEYLNVNPAQNDKYIKNINALYVLVQAAKEYRMVK